MTVRSDVVDPGVVRIVLPGRASHAYLFLGRRLALVDCGSPESGHALLIALRELEVPRHRVSLVVLTHEHAGHAGAAASFPDALLAAHPLAASKLRHGDEARTKFADARPPDLELEHGSALHLGGFSFEVVHTPGHTSGSICLYERSRGLSPATPRLLRAASRFCPGAARAGSTSRACRDSRRSGPGCSSRVTGPPPTTRAATWPRPRPRCASAWRARDRRRLSAPRRSRPSRE